MAGKLGYQEAVMKVELSVDSTAAMMAALQVVHLVEQMAAVRGAPTAERMVEQMAVMMVVLMVA